jgi:2-polyprenyl-3-methyl-5-hydroxy-6-metoxy-1,4-benzoquinol methylase
VLISDAYKAEQKRLHRNERYGSASLKWAATIVALIDRVNPKTILDYGAGKGHLEFAIASVMEGRTMAAYDPAVKEISKMPEGVFDLVCCIDVLEHIEPECLDDVLDNIRRKTGRCAFLTIHTGPAGKFLSDGRNAHLIQKPVSWWRDRLDTRFTIPVFGMLHETFWAVCEPVKP